MKKFTNNECYKLMEEQYKKMLNNPVNKNFAKLNREYFKLVGSEEAYEKISQCFNKNKWFVDIDDDIDDMTWKFSYKYYFPYGYCRICYNRLDKAFCLDIDK
jgi:hypothetical protein